MKVDNIVLPKFRKEKFMTPPKFERTPFEAIFWDIETSSKPVQGGKQIDYKLSCSTHAVIDTNGVIKSRIDKTCWNIDDFVSWVNDYVLNLKNPLLIAHNTGFDLQYSGLIDLLLEYDFMFDVYFQRMTTSIIVMKRDKYKITFMDTLNWFKATLQSLGESIGYPKMGINFDDCSDLELATYCQNDVEIMVKAMQKYCKWLHGRYGIMPKYTMSSDSLKAYRRVMPERSVYVHNNTRLMLNEFSAYYGGRTENYRKGDLSGRMWYYVDVNSLYPYVMSNHAYSGKLIRDFDVSTIEYDVFDNENVNVCANIIVNTDEPFLPYHTDTNTIFPVGRWLGWFCGDELEAILESGKYEQIVSCQKYEATVDFSQYITSLYDARMDAKKQGDPVETYFLKLFMNTLYGKFGQRNDQLEYIGESENEHFGNYKALILGLENNKEIKVLGHQMYEVHRNILGFYSCPIIAAEITANARAYMWKLACQAGRSNVVYTDTDSLFVNQTGYDNLKPYMNDTALGKLKTELASDHLVLHAPKHYVFGEQQKAKGVSPRDKVLENSKILRTRIKTLTQHLQGLNKDQPDEFTQTAYINEKNNKCAHVDLNGYTPIDVSNLDVFLPKGK